MRCGDGLGVLTDQGKGCFTALRDTIWLSMDWFVLVCTDIG